MIAGVVVLSTEFVWASSILRIGQEQSARLFANLRNPWLLAAALAGAVVLAVGLYVHAPGVVELTSESTASSPHSASTAGSSAALLLLPVLSLLPRVA